MRMTIRAGALLLFSLATVSLAPNIARVQEYTQRLRSPAAVKGFIGGESHDSYVIRARKGRIMTVKLSWRRERNGPEYNHAEFYVSNSGDFGGDSRVTFGRDSKDGKRWSGTIPSTGDYYIYVMAHPTAHYTLRVSMK